MKICIAGGGRVGRYLAQSLLANHHSVVIIEPIEAQCRMLADQLDIPVICGDSISMDILRTADAASCDAFVAVTGSDEDNLVAVCRDKVRHVSLTPLSFRLCPAKATQKAAAPGRIPPPCRSKAQTHRLPVVAGLSPPAFDVLPGATHTQSCPPLSSADMVW